MKERKTREVSLVSGAIETREKKGEGANGGVVVSGYAIRFNEESVKMYDYLIETISPTCVTAETLAESDVKMTLFHNREKLLARWNKGEGSLRLEVDAEGVRFEFEPADDELGRMCVEHVRRGDLSGCSFTFVPGEYEIEEVGDVCKVRHTKFAELLEMTIGTDPAYPTTSVEAESREFYNTLREARREADEAERAAADAMEAEKECRARELAMARAAMKVSKMKIEEEREIFFQ